MRVWSLIIVHDWSVKGIKKGEHGRKMANVSYFCDGMYVGYEKYLREKYRQITENEQRWENIDVKDAEVVLVAYGISSRVCKEAVKNARAQGIKLGLIRPKMITPFPVKAFEEISPDCKGIEIVEMSIKGQMTDDVGLDRLFEQQLAHTIGEGLHRVVENIEECPRKKVRRSLRVKIAGIKSDRFFNVVRSAAAEVCFVIVIDQLLCLRCDPERKFDFIVSYGEILLLLALQRLNISRKHGTFSMNDVLEPINSFLVSP